MFGLFLASSFFCYFCYFHCGSLSILKPVSSVVDAELCLFFFFQSEQLMVSTVFGKKKQTYIYIYSVGVCENRKVVRM